MKYYSLLESETTLSTANNFSMWTRIRLVNGNALDSGTVNVITHKELDGKVKGTISLYPQQEIVLGKMADDTLEATGNTCLAVPIFDVTT